MKAARVHDQIKAAIAVAALHVLLGYALISAFGIKIPAAARQQGLKLFEVAPEPPPPVEKPVPDRPKNEKREGAASPPNLKTAPAPIVAPAPPTPLIVPQPVIAAPMPGLGDDRSAGAADVPGPGTGSGGEGTGSGGGTGDGDGDYTPPERIKGRLRDSDYPRAAGETGIGKTITVRFTVEANGRVGECAVVQSSGNAILDDATCRAIGRRYRYEPSRDADGRAVPSIIVEEHIWTAHDR